MLGGVRRSARTRHLECGCLVGRLLRCSPLRHLNGDFSWTDSVSYHWRGPLSDDEMVDLVCSHGGNPEPGWWNRVRRHSLGWVVARAEDGTVLGFVNVAWDGGVHAFLLDTKTRGTHQHRGIGTELVRQAARFAGGAGCEWLHVDFESPFGTFYYDACGFARTDAGLIHLSDD